MIPLGILTFLVGLASGPVLLRRPACVQAAMERADRQSALAGPVLAALLAMLAFADYPTERAAGVCAGGLLLALLAGAWARATAGQRLAIGTVGGVLALYAAVDGQGDMMGSLMGVAGVLVFLSVMACVLLAPFLLGLLWCLVAWAVSHCRPLPGRRSRFWVRLAVGLALALLVAGQVVPRPWWEQGRRTPVPPVALAERGEAP